MIVRVLLLSALLISLSCTRNKNKTEKNDSNSIELPVPTNDISTEETSIENTEATVETPSVQLWDEPLNDSLVSQVLELIDNLVVPDSTEQTGYDDYNFINEIRAMQVNSMPILDFNDLSTESFYFFSFRFSRSFVKAVMLGEQRYALKFYRMLCALYKRNNEPQAFLRNLLIAKAYMDQYKGLGQLMMAHVNKSQPDTTNPIVPEFNYRLGMINNDIGQIANNDIHAILFWNDRKNDALGEQMDSLLIRAASKKYADTLKGILSERQKITVSRNNQPAQPQTIYFTPYTFFHKTYPPAPSLFDKTNDLLKYYLVQADSALRKDSVIISGTNLYNTLMNLQSRFFDKRLTYFALQGDSSSGYAWKKIDIRPSLLFYALAWDDGVGDLGIEISIFDRTEQKKTILIAGIPNKSAADGMIPQGFFQSQRKSRSIQVAKESTYFREAVNEWSTPPSNQAVKKLFSIDKYLYTYGNENYYAPNDLSISGQNNDGLTFGGDTMYHIVQQKSHLYTLNENNDSVYLHTDTSSGGYGDGVLCLSAARFDDPIFTDANGDGLMDILVKNSIGLILFERKKDGSYKVNQI